ncbi:DgyrCDS6477 [Dimorphilus gyrociliatus]|uniref:DgyrCDS6477 n=1 Tax=Dimorphilus gyrociliatus TaxID=2664684 RepID=A0A7I8VN69_9ANNE|nr:DgyrCDS6477 [Dimorphilus gyrociliatus]
MTTTTPVATTTTKLLQQQLLQQQLLQQLLQQLQLTTTEATTTTTMKPTEKSNIGKVTIKRLVPASEKNAGQYETVADNETPPTGDDNTIKFTNTSPHG